VTPIFLVPPGKLIQRSQFHDPALVLAYNDPAAYPDLYRNSVRIDVEHLNAKGAAEFSSLLARQLAAKIRP
jgi:hypothetical protein